MKQILLTDIHQASYTRPEGYVARVLSRGVIKGDTLYIEDKEYEQLLEEYREPTTTELIGNFTAASVRWVLSGFALVNQQTLEARVKACDECEYWDGQARLGLGKCRLCGCTKVKHWWASERCPKNKWPP